MSTRIPDLDFTRERGGEHAFGGIRDGGRRGRRRAMYEFLTRHHDGRGIKPGTEAHLFYLECLEQVRTLSRSRSWRPQSQ